MAWAFTDVSFNKNLAGLLIAAILLLSVSASSFLLLESRNLTTVEMASIRGQGWSTALVVGGALVVGIGLAAICTGGTIAIAAAFVAQPALVSAGLSAFGVGTTVAGIGAGAYGLGDWLGSR